MFDEPTSYLDIKNRLRAAKAIRSLIGPETYVICIEHDLSILDYISDYICCFWGVPGVYGFVSIPLSVRQGINAFLFGWIPQDNVRLRDSELKF
jgi:ATP-binding cassette subfamily E protein 1